MKEIRLLLYFIIAETFGLEWSQTMKPIVDKYGCIMNALRHYHLIWLFDVFFWPSTWIHHIYFIAVMWWRRTIVHNL